MERYSGVERAIAKSLDAFPVFRRVAKGLYQRLNYWIHREKEVRCELNPQVDMRSAMRTRRNRDDESYFFGYYDKTPWSPNMNSILMHREQDQKVEIVRVLLGEKEDQVLGTSLAWNYQQGSMAQWITSDIVACNGVQNRRLGTYINSIANGMRRFVPWPIQTVHPSGRKALCLNYKRLYKIRPEYGYEPEVENFSADASPGNDGVWRVNLGTSKAELVISLSHLCAHHPRPEMDGALHKVNHAIYSPEGKRFVFMHRWTGGEGKFSRLYVADSKGANLRLLMDDRMVSHYSWRDEDHLLVWGRTEKCGDHYYLVNVVDSTWEVVGKGILDKYGDGHPSYSPDRRWIVTDTYPDKARQRHLLLFDTKTENLAELGRFFAPWAFDGAKRCDLHPRWSPDGKYISIDSAHEGVRKSYILDVSAIVDDAD